MPDELAWTHPVMVADLPEQGIDLELVPEETNRASLARHAGVLAVPRLVARLNLVPEGRGGAMVEGTLEATVRQACVVSLEPFDQAIVEPISLRFVPAERLTSDRAGAIDAGQAGAPDPLIGGKIDLAAVVAEFLALAIDPYPCKPGAVFTPPPESEAAGRPTAFAALEKLKAGKDKKG
ncbi:MAG: DUF177 domain-containing protein [Xanthobacteraceae bacterium]|nr:DUF177 domain-containing protein [Xanthobacteraceae bacterium]